MILTYCFVVLISDTFTDQAIHFIKMTKAGFDETSYDGDRTLVDLLILHGLVVTMDASFRVLEDGAVAVSDGKILEIGDTAAICSKYRGKKVLDARRKIVMPGLINAHTHAPMNIFRGFADDLPLNEWLYNYIFPLETEFVNRDNVQLGTRLAIAEMLRSGTTTFNDMYYYVDVMAGVIDELGIRAILANALVDLPVHNGKTLDKALKQVEEIMQNWNGHPRIQVGVAAHAPYTAKPNVYQAAKALADKYNVLLHTHLSETRWEFDLILERYGFTPVQHLENIGVLASNLVVAHAIHLTREDMELLAHRDVGVAHNPQCNMKLANGTAPIPELLKLGVRIGIGTDGVASNNDLDLFDEIRSAALAQKLINGDPTVMDAKTVVEAVTIGGARMLGLDNKIGSLEAGKQADIILVDLTQPHAWPNFNAYSLITYSLRGSDVDTVLVDGRILMENRQLTTLNESDLYEEVHALSDRIRDWQHERTKSQSQPKA